MYAYLEPVKRVDIAKLRKKMYTGSEPSDVMMASMCCVVVKAMMFELDTNY